MIESQARVLRRNGHQVVIASAGPAKNWGDSSLILPDLDYQSEGAINIAPLLAVQADLWIIHNPTLGLNIAYPDMIEQAAQAGVRMLLQIHDFVEDGRPANYQLLANREKIYPDAPQIHYATINKRDQTILQRAGVPEERCHYLPNAVNPPTLQGTTPSETLLFYPVRGIRRKNLGELCLLAAHAPAGTRFAVALRSGSEEPDFLHDDWVQFAQSLGLPISFDVVGQDPSSFRDWLEQSTHLVTTSIHEGFGLTFLDPAFLGKPLIGRDLPEITRDFTKYGTLYQSIPVPLSDLPGLAEIYREQFSTTMAAYGKVVTDHEITAGWKNYSSEGVVDFGNLPEEFQRRIIETTKLPELASWLAQALKQPATQIDTSPWSLETYAKNLQEIMTSTCAPGSVDWISPTKILDQFLLPEKFHFLRSRLTATTSEL